MFRFFRKHQWLLIVVLSITVISFVLWVPNIARKGGGGNAGGGDFGSINGKKISQAVYLNAKRETELFFLFHYGSWPERNPNISAEALEKEIYVRLMLIQKARDLGIHVSDDDAAKAANAMLRSPELARALGIGGQSVPLEVLVKKVLEPEGLSADDFENFVRDDLAVEQLQLTYGLSGQLVTPQEAAAEYTRENQELSAQIVFFSASNYLSQAAVTPAVVAQFYTNYMADYRLPDRVQVSYVAFSISNYLGAAEQKLAKTNLDAQVNYIYEQYGLQAVPDAKTPDEAKAKIREAVIHQRALADANQQADDFAQAAFNAEPANAQNFSAIAKQKDLTVQTTAPFSKDYGPEEFVAPEIFTKTAFELTPDSPISEPVAGPDAVYVIALDQQLPSEIPPFEKIRARVTRDFQMREATLLAQRAGTNFVRALFTQMASGKSFAAASVAAGFQPQLLPPFSLSTRDLPELDGRAELNQLKQAAFTTPIGRPSGFEETDDGGFVIFVQSQLPIDQEKMSEELPQFTAELRRRRQQEAFNEWLQREANRELINTPLFKQAAAK